MKSKRGYCVHRCGDERIALAVTRQGRDRWNVDSFERGAAGSPPSGPLARSMMRDADDVAWLIGDNEARTSTVSLPPLKGKALMRAAQGTVAREEGGTPESWVVSCQVVDAKRASVSNLGSGADDGRLQNVFMVHAARQAVEAHVADGIRWGVRPGLILPAYLALDLFFRNHGPDRDANAAWTVVFVSRTMSFMCISTRSHLLLMRRLPQNLSQGDDYSEYLDRVATEIERSIFFARQTVHSAEVERIVVCGDRDLVPMVVDRLQTQGLAPAVSWEIEQMFQWPAGEPRAEDLLAAVGGVLSIDGSVLNLMPKRAHGSLSRHARRRSLIATGSVALAAVPLLLVGGLMTAHVQRDYLNHATARVEEAEARAADAEAAYRAQRVLMARENRIERFTGSRPDLESVLRQVAALAPPQVTFTVMRLQKNGYGTFVLHLEGESGAALGADAQTAFLRFLTALRGCDFARVSDEPGGMHIKPWIRDVGEGERTVFSLDLHLLSAAPPDTPPEGV